MLDMYKDIWDCNETIEDIKTEDDDMCLIVTTTKNCYTAEIDTKQNCCETYGGYIVCEDDISSFIGSSLLKITLTDVALNNHIVEEINNTFEKYYSWWDYNNIQFINFETTKGLLQFVVYNCHNGYYGHDITIRQDDTTIYSDRI